MRVKFVRTLVAEFKQTESNDATKYDTFYTNSKAETILMKGTLMYLNQLMVQSCQTYKIHLEKVHVGLLIQSQIIMLIFQSTML